MIVEATSSEGATVDFSVSATDKCSSSATVTAEPASGSLFPMGQSEVTCRAVDGLGNSSECTFTVTVVDRTPPQITCTTEDITVQGSTSGNPPLPHSALRWPPQGGPPVYAITAEVSYPDPVATDTCQIEEIQVVCAPPSGSRFALGTHTVTARALDAAGNEATCTFQVTVAGLQAFIRGDSNLDSRVDIADPVATVSFLFLRTFALQCKDAADVNDDSLLDIADVVYELNYIFRGGPRPAEPFYPLCGTDPTSDALGCERYYPCE
jgi:hypothetical protein